MTRKIGNKTFEFGKKTYTMGILNITPDSFSDGGCYMEEGSAYKRALNIIEEGADILDIGAESSRPGSEPVNNVEEWARLEPVLNQLAGRISIPISLDTYKSDVAEKALQMGVQIINDISGLKMDNKMAEVVARYDAYVVLMHMRGNPKTMQEAPRYDNVVEEVVAELKESIEIGEKAGIKRDKIILDPGIGFAKRFEDNLILIKNIDKISALGYPLLLGVSRKRFIGEILDNPTDKRLAGSLAVAVYSASKGVDIMRVHDVRETVEALKVTEAILKAGIN